MPESTIPANKTESPLDRVEHLTPRAVLLLIWLVLANVWSNRHLGIGWDKPIWSLLLGALGVGFGLFEAADQNLKKRWLGKIVACMVQTPILATIYALLGITACFLTSVSIVNDPSGTAFAAMLASPDNPNIALLSEDNKGNPKEPLTLRPVWTTPLGKLYALQVDGYVPETISVYPVWGVTLRPDRDLRTAPSVLLRLPTGSVSASARVKIWRKRAALSAILIADCHKPWSSILVGKPQPIPPKMVEDWRLHEVALGNRSVTVLAQLIAAWMNPKLLRPPDLLQPGDEIVAMAYNGSDQQLAVTQLLLTSERLQDAPMQTVQVNLPVPNEQGVQVGCPEVP